MKPMKKKSINQALRSEREVRGWSRAYVAEQIDLADPKTLGRWERGVSSPNAQFARQLCLLFGKSKEELGLVSLRGQYECINARHALFWNVPCQRNPFFTGRQELLTHISTILHSPGELISLSAVALGGMGGIGKTQAVVEYAYRFRNAYHIIIWIQADTNETLLADCKKTVNALHLRQRGQESVYDTLKQWLRDQTGWLLILDNVENLAAINWIIPVESTGHILLTTRRSSLGGIAQHLTLHGFTPEEGALFLFQRIKKGTDLAEWSFCERKAARFFTSLVAGLPLALDQAGAYVEERGCMFTHYVNLYQQSPALLLQRRGEACLDHVDSVGTMLIRLCDKLENLCPAVRVVLRFCAFLAPGTFPEELLLECLTYSRLISQDQDRSLLICDEALSVLRRSSLLQSYPETQMLAVHPLLQIIVKATMDQQEQRQWVEQMVALLGRFFLDRQMGPAFQRYFPQLQICLALINTWNVSSPAAGQLMEHLGAKKHISGYSLFLASQNTCD